MQDQLKKRAEEIYCSALEIKSPDQREIYLNHSCCKDAKLRATVDKMLALQPTVEKFFQDLNVSRFLTKEDFDLHKDSGTTHPTL